MRGAFRGVPIAYVYVQPLQAALFPWLPVRTVRQGWSEATGTEETAPAPFTMGAGIQHSIPQSSGRDPRGYSSLCYLLFEAGDDGRSHCSPQPRGNERNPESAPGLRAVQLQQRQQNGLGGITRCPRYRGIAKARFTACSLNGRLPLPLTHHFTSQPVHSFRNFTQSLYPIIKTILAHRKKLPANRKVEDISQRLLLPSVGIIKVNSSGVLRGEICSLTFRSSIENRSISLSRWKRWDSLGHQRSILQRKTVNIQGRREWRINNYLDVLCERLPHVLDNEVDSLPYCGVVFEVNDNERLSLFFSKLSGQGDLLARVERSQQGDHHRHESQHGCCDGCGGRPVVRLPGTEVDCQHSRGACHGVRLGHRHARVSRTDRSCSFPSGGEEFQTIRTRLPAPAAFPRRERAGVSQGWWDRYPAEVQSP